MTTEDDFQRLLDVNPEDHHTRLILADFLEDRGDVRGPGYRAMGELRLYPSRRSLYDMKKGRYTDTYVWSWHEVVTGRPYASGLKMIWFSKIAHPRYGTNRYPWSSRREAEDAAAIAFSLIPLNKRHRAYQ